MPTVLVVDDEFGIVDVLETVLTDEGYRVLTACNGKQGLERLVTEKPDVVLLDFMMPILVAPKCCARWRRSRLIGTSPSL